MLTFTSICADIIASCSIKNNDQEIELDIESPMFISVNSDKDVTCPICTKQIRSYMKPNTNSSCSCKEFIMCKTCIDKLVTNKCPFCTHMF